MPRKLTRLRGRRAEVLLVLAALLVLPVFLRPALKLPGLSYAYLFVVDVTQSMNVRDADPADPRRSRLEAAKAAVVAAMNQLPCGSRMSMALFAGSETLVMFEPLEICAHYPAMEQVVQSIDWRMAWTGNSDIESGLLAAMQEAKSRGLELVFLTDGDQAPHREQLRVQRLTLARGDALGLVVGIGGDQERPIPKLDAQNRVIGYWQVEDAIRNGFNPNLTTLLETDRDGVRRSVEQGNGPREHVSALRDDELQKLSKAAGLGYARYDGSGQYLRAMANPQLARVDRAPRDLRPGFAAVAALLGLLAWLPRPRALRRQA
jgi:mxaL protein